jgi:hypothetical protein
MEGIMKQRYVLFDLLIVFIFLTGFALMPAGWYPCHAESTSPKAVVWGKIFGGKHVDMAHAVQQTSDGGYIVAGDTHSSGSGNGDLYIMKLDPQGSMIWERTFGGESLDGAESVRQTSDGGYIVAGGTRSFGSGKGDAYILKLDQKGDKVWEKTFGGKEWDDAHAIRQTSDGGYIVAGGTRSFGSGKGDAYILKLDQKGAKVWEKTFKGNGSADTLSIQQTSDGEYIAAGRTYSFSSGKGEAYILKLDEKGNRLWEKTFEGKGRCVTRCVQQTADGGYILVGQTSSMKADEGEAYILKLDEKGNRVWEKMLGMKDLDASSFVLSKNPKKVYANDIDQTSDGGYVLAIVIVSRVAVEDSHIIKLDKKGEKVWQKLVGIMDLDKGTLDSLKMKAGVYVNFVQQTSDGGYIVGGGITIRKKGMSNIYIIKTDPKGNVH